MKNRCLVVTALALAASFCAPAARAAGTRNEAQARKRFEQAEHLYRGGQFADALTEYEAGYELAPLPGFLINIAQCQRRLGNLQQALLSYRKFILVAPDSKFAPEVKSLMGELEQVLAGTAPGGSEKKPERAAESSLFLASSLDDEAPLPVPKAERDSRIPIVVENQPDATPIRSRPRYWLWGSAAAVAVAAGLAAYFALRDPGTTTISQGSLLTLGR